MPVFNNTIAFESRPILDISGGFQRITVHDSFFALHREIEKAYAQLPWPPSLKNVAVYTLVQGGRGDISSAAKVICMLKRICKDLHIDWVIQNGAELLQEAPLFLHEIMPLDVIIRDAEAELDPSLAQLPVDVVIDGPYQDLVFPIQVVKATGRRCSSVIYIGYQENDLRPQELFVSFSLEKIRDLAHGSLKLYQEFFPFQMLRTEECLTMGLYEGSGILLSPSLVSSPLSQKYSCLSYLMNLSDVGLKTDILASLHINPSSLLPSEEGGSFNFGYAHKIDSLMNFIDCVAVHEKKKNITIVLNQKSARFPTIIVKNFALTLLHAQRRTFYEELGFSSAEIIDHSMKVTITLCQPTESMRKITVIFRERFTPQDINRIQLAAERIMATGDSSAAEAFASRCKLYVYETLSHKSSFLAQQVALARSLGYDLLAELLKGFGSGSPGSPMISSEIKQVLLDDEALSEQTYQFCVTITKMYNFEDVLQGHIKRSLYLYAYPELQKKEFEVIGEPFFSELRRFLTDHQIHSISMATPEVSGLAQAIQTALFCIADDNQQ